MAKGARNSYSAFLLSVTQDVQSLRQKLEYLRERYAVHREAYDKAREKRSYTWSKDVAWATYRRNLQAWKVRERERYLKYLSIFSDAVAAGQMPIQDAIRCAENEAKRNREKRPRAPKPDASDYGGYEKDEGEG